MAIADEMALVEHLLDDIHQITLAAHERYRSYDPAILVEHSARAAATCTYDHMVANADRLWADRSGISAIEIRGLKVWLIGTTAVIRFKKMDEDGRTRNYPTKQAKSYDRRTAELPGLPTPAIRLTAGYWLDDTQTEFLRAQIARPWGPGVTEWCAAIVPPSAPNGRATWEDVTRQQGMF
jgi:hypothetical protein